MEVEVSLPDRTLFFFATANPIKDETGKVILALAHAVDITERKQAEEALRGSEKRFDLALQGTGVWDWEMVKDEVVYSIQWKSMLGYADHEVKNSLAGWKYLWHPMIVCAFNNQWRITSPVKQAAMKLFTGCAIKIEVGVG